MNILQQIPNLKNYLLGLQSELCSLLEKEEHNKKFVSDEWQYAERGGGITRVLTEGKVFEKAAINFSHVEGQSLPIAATLKRPELKNCTFQALGVSVVIHPLNPYVPTTHLNVRFIAVEKPNHPLIWWFGGGFDLTPYYGFVEDCIHWHHMAKTACDTYDANAYTHFKRGCDEYFYLPHRKEARGIGGIFFDDLNDKGFDVSFAFIRAVGDHFMQAYQPIVATRKNLIFGETERQFQLYRRGRYVEFNLLYDRGTLFGLQSGGRTESILVSLPPEVSWKYHWEPKIGSPEAKLYEEFLPVRDWVSS